MNCTNCGGVGGVEERRLLFRGSDRSNRELTLHLCEECLREFREEAGIDVE